MKYILLLVCVTGALAGANPSWDQHWNLFKNINNKRYGSQEDAMRRQVWEENLAYIQTHNLEADLGKHLFWVGMNEYGDLTDGEYRQFLGHKMANATRKGIPVFMAPSNVEIPDEVDWREKGYVTKVKNQLQCGSCWAFSATGSLEGQHFKKTKKLVSLSEQNLVDCSTKQGNHGCGGGLMDKAFEYIKMNNGIDTEESYPYKARNGPCEFKPADVGATCTGFVDIQEGNEGDLKTAVATIGPIAVAIDASHSSFRFYKTGVYDEAMCSATKLDHGVLVVGYGTEMGAYWLVKNSWGDTWGTKGYIKMARNKENMCGIATSASYPLV